MSGDFEWLVGLPHKERWVKPCAGSVLSPPSEAKDHSDGFPTRCGQSARIAKPPRGGIETAMDELLLDYLPLVIFIAVALSLGLALLIVPFIVAYKAPDPDKLSAYECGFNAFDDARMKFDVRFYLVAILFIIFDLEVSFLFPWAVAFKDVGVFGFWAMMIFLGVLTIGFIYEWRKGALEWD